jgi:hypothetical protein
MSLVSLGEVVLVVVRVKLVALLPGSLAGFFQVREVADVERLVVLPDGDVPLLHVLAPGNA